MKYRYRVVLLNLGSSCGPDLPMLSMIQRGEPCPRGAFGGGKRERGARLDNRPAFTRTYPRRPQTASEEQEKGAAHPEDGGAEKPSWWRRFFGVE
jgi:hypothetical protein